MSFSICPHSLSIYEPLDSERSRRGVTVEYTYVQPTPIVPDDLGDHFLEGENHGFVRNRGR